MRPLTIIAAIAATLTVGGVAAQMNPAQSRHLADFRGLYVQPREYQLHHAFTPRRSTQAAPLYQTTYHSPRYSTTVWSGGYTYHRWRGPWRPHLDRRAFHCNHLR